MRPVAALVAVMLLSMTAAQAQNLQTRECTASNFDAIAQAITALPDNRQKSTASAELDNARKAMSEGRNDDCRDHLLKATLQTK